MSIHAEYCFIQSQSISKHHWDNNIVGCAGCSPRSMFWHTRQESTLFVWWNVRVDIDMEWSKHLKIQWFRRGYWLLPKGFCNSCLLLPKIALASIWGKVRIRHHQRANDSIKRKRKPNCALWVSKQFCRSEPSVALRKMSNDWSLGIYPIQRCPIGIYLWVWSCHRDHVSSKMAVWLHFPKSTTKLIWHNDIYTSYNEAGAILVGHNFTWAYTLMKKRIRDGVPKPQAFWY